MGAELIFRGTELVETSNPEANRYLALARDLREANDKSAKALNSYLEYWAMKHPEAFDENGELKEGWVITWNH